jgi:hypothetical protein
MVAGTPPCRRLLPRPRFHTRHARDAITVAAAAHQDRHTAPAEQKDALLWLQLFRPRP